MNTHPDKTQENKTQAVEKGLQKLQNNPDSSFQFTDNRPEAIAQRKMQEAINNSPKVKELGEYQEMMNNSPKVKELGAYQKMMNNSPQVKQLNAYQDMMNNSPQVKQLSSYQDMMNNSPQVKQQRAYQTMADHDTSKTAQRKENKKDKEPLQGKFEAESAQLEATAEAPRPNNTGLPNPLKSGIEKLSGMSMDHVKVHYNSNKPAQLQAHAYAQGSQIHVAPGQEQHLPHEAWHVAQQKQGRVKPTIQMKGNVNVNDDKGLEQEADVMGMKALEQDAGGGEDTNRNVQDSGSDNGIVQRRNGANPQHFQITGTATNAAICQIVTNKDWQSTTGNLGELDDIEMREYVTFNHNPAIDMPGYPVVVPMIPGMTLVGNILTKVAGAMQGGAGTDTHNGAGFAPSFTVAGGVPNLTKGAWTLIGTQVYQYRDRTLGTPWQALHAGAFIITRAMAVNPLTHEYELTFSKVGPNCNAIVTTPIAMKTSEAMRDVGAARPDQTPLWTALDNEIRVTQQHTYQTVGGAMKLINGINVPVTYQITEPAYVNRPPAFIPFETVTPAEYNSLIPNIEAGLTTVINNYMNGLGAMPARIIIMISKAAGGVRQQALFTNGGVGAGPTMRILFRHGKFSSVDPNDLDTSQPGRESKRGWKDQTRNNNWQKATVIHEMGHMLHAFNDIEKFQSATVDMASANAAPAAIQPEMFKIANVNQQIINALAAANYKDKWTYGTSNPAEVVAEVWTALMHGRNVPRGLAAVYLAYGGMRNAAIDLRLAPLFPGNAIPVFNEPEESIPFI